MDAITYPLEIVSYRAPPLLPVEGNTALGRFLSQIDLNLEFIGECPLASREASPMSNRFEVPPPFQCVDSNKCIGLTRNMQKMEKIKSSRINGEDVLHVLIVKIVCQLEKKIEYARKQSHHLPNVYGKLAFAHYITAVVLLYGLNSKVIDDDRRYHYHRREAMKHNKYCVRIWALPKELDFSV